MSKSDKGDCFVVGLLIGAFVAGLTCILCFGPGPGVNVPYSTLDEVCKEITGEKTADFSYIDDEIIHCKNNVEKIYDNGKIVLLDNNV